MASVFDVAKCILRNREETTAWQLQKLCYYTKAWGLALSNDPIFAEPFEAWRNGPVCRALYYRHKGKKNVPRGFFDVGADLPLEERAIAMAVLKKYGSMTGEELRDLSHSEEPWRETRGDLPESQNCDRKIEDGLMRSYYSRDKESFRRMDDAMLEYIAEERLRTSSGTVSFKEMMGRFGVTEDDLEGEDVDIEVEPIVL